MTRRARFALAAIFAVSSIIGQAHGEITAGAAPAANPLLGPCTGWYSEIRPAMGSRVIFHRVHALTHCAVAWGHFPGGYSMATCIEGRESGFWPWADSGSSKGLFQHNGRYWAWRATHYLRRSWFSGQPHWPPSPFVARANVLAAMVLAQREGLGPWGGGC